MLIRKRKDAPQLYIPEPMILRRPSRLASPDSGTRMIWEAVDRFGKEPLCQEKRTDSATKAGTI